MTPVVRWNTGGVFQTYSGAGMMSIATPWRRRRTRRRSRGRAASGRRRRARPTEARNLHRADGRLRVAFLQALRRVLGGIGPLDRTGDLPRAALIEVSLQELAHQLLTPSVQFAFEFTLTHLLGLAEQRKALTSAKTASAAEHGVWSRETALWVMSRNRCFARTREPRPTAIAEASPHGAVPKRRVKVQGAPEGRTAKRRGVVIRPGWLLWLSRKQAGANAVPPVRRTKTERP